ncbi:MAG: RagB/SusD family nutrient uptake outer membrane protein [Candidatus Cryptobacteroides sp.]
MKKYIGIFMAAAAAFSLVSCSLDEKSYMEIEKDEYMNSAKEAQNVLLGVYRNLNNDAMYGMNLSLYFTLGTDEAKVEGSTPNSWRDVPSNTFSTSNSYVEATWKALYNAIYDANDFIENLSRKAPQWSEGQTDLAAIYMAEARTLRAFFYFELVRWFGHPVLMKTTAESRIHPSEFTQPDPVEVYEFIEQDLKYAAEVLPWAVDDVYRSDSQYRVSKGTALGLLAKVYATWAGYPVNDESKWEDAANTAKIVVESGKHHLLDDYEQLWVNTCNNTWDPQESLFEVSFYTATITGSDPIGRIGKWNGVTATDGSGDFIRIAANWKAMPTFAKDWKDAEPGDKRWALSFADYKYTADGKVALGTYTPEGSSSKENLYLDIAVQDGVKPDLRKPFNNTLCPAKWDLVKYVEKQLADANYSNVNWYILRYSDVLLLYAEALNEWHKGPTTDAYSAVNMVRRRGYGLPVHLSGAADLPSDMGYEQFQDAVRKERSYELAFEGHRRRDLVRWGIYYETIMETAAKCVTWHEQMPSLYIISDYTVKGRHEVLPIPQRDLDMMPQCVQNEGWR